MRSKVEPVSSPHTPCGHIVMSLASSRCARAGERVVCVQSRRIDVNADAGESFGVWRSGDDASLFGVVSSVNLACGFHAGDPATMLRSVELAVRHGTAIGAHPGFPDLVGFGRRDIAMEPRDVYATTLYQIGALAAVAASLGAQLAHVKAHGALYLRMARDRPTADAVAAAVAAHDARLPLTVLAGPGGAVMRDAGAAAGLTMLLEAFPDRAYTPDGSLAPRSLPGAVLSDPAQVAERAVAIAVDGVVEALDGSLVPLQADTLCLHGDNVHAVENARTLAAALHGRGVTIAAPGRA